MNLAKLLQDFKKYLRYAHVVFKYVSWNYGNKLCISFWLEVKSDENDANDFEIFA